MPACGRCSTTWRPGDTLDEFWRQFPSVHRDRAVEALEFARETLLTVRVLLDENLPYDLTKVLTGHLVFTVQGLGWAGTKNGALLKRASGECDVFVTMDGNIEHQQNLADSHSEKSGMCLECRGVVVPCVPGTRISQGEQ